MNQESIIISPTEEDIEALRNKIKAVYPDLHEAACSPYVKKIVHGKRYTEDRTVVDQFFMHFDSKEDQVMWNLQYSNSNNYDLK